MTHLQRTSRREYGFYLVLALVGLYLLWPYANSLYRRLANAPTEWREEVQLTSGQTIIVRRSVKADRRAEPGGLSFWFDRGQSLEIEAATGSTPLPTWRAVYFPLLLDRDPTTQEWFLVSTVSTCEAWIELNKPDLPYVEHRLRTSEWVRVPLSKELIGRSGNLLTAIDIDGEPPLHTLSSKEKRMQEVSPAITYRKVVDRWDGCRSMTDVRRTR